MSQYLEMEPEAEATVIDLDGINPDEVFEPCPPLTELVSPDVAEKLEDDASELL